MRLEMLDYGSQICADDPGEPTTGVPRISVTDEEANLLAQFARGKYVVEVGTGLGVSTRALHATALGLCTVDTDPWVHKHVWPALPDRIHTFAEFPFRLGAWFHMAFIDGDHQTDSVTQDIMHARGAIGNRGLIICHDAKIPDVAAALDDSWFVVDTHHGLAIKTFGAA